MKRLLLLLTLCCACDPGDDAWNGTAPAAPNAPDDVDAGCDEPADDNTKHPGLHSAYPVQLAGWWYDWCGSGPTSAACWHKGSGYNYYAVFQNITPYGQQPRNWNVQRINWSFCYSGIPTTGTIPAGSATLCTYGHCTDVSNSSITVGGCRSGWTFLPMYLPAGGYAHAELFVNMNAWWQPEPMYGPSITIYSISYLD